MTYFKVTPASECYEELIKMKEDRLQVLSEHQQRVQHHERSLVHIKNQLAKCLQQQEAVASKFNTLVHGDVWVTAEQHAKIHNVYEKSMKQCSDLLVLKKKRHEMIDQEATHARLIAGHIVGIERGLTALQKQIQQQQQVSSSESFLEKWLKPKILQQKNNTVEPAFLYGDKKYSSSSSSILE